MAQDKRKRQQRPGQGQQKVMSKGAQEAAKGLQVRPQGNGGAGGAAVMQSQRAQPNPLMAALAMGANAMQPGMGQAGQGMRLPGLPGMAARQPNMGAAGGRMTDPRMQLMVMLQQRQAAANSGMPGQQGMRPPLPQQRERKPVQDGYAGNLPEPVGYGRQLPMDEERIREARQLLTDYMSAKALTDERIIVCQEWWRQRNWTMIQEERGTVGSQPHKSGTAWLKSSIVGKHADYMESYPEPLFLARNPEDEPEAQHLTEIVPVVLKQIGFEETYSDVGWQKLTEGTGMYAVTWDGQAQHGLGDICIRKVNVLNLFTEPGIEDIQDSTNVFLVRMEDDRKLLAQYPQLNGKLGRSTTVPKEYREKEKKERRGKTAVIDWYYKKWQNGGEVLHYCQFVSDVVLYASENDPQCQQKGFYWHGLYPFVPDKYLPDADTIYAQGLVDEGKGTQTAIDTIDQAMVTNAVCNATPRYFANQSGGINPEQFLDWSIPIVDANVNLGADSIKRIEVPQMDGNTLSFYQAKIEELRSVTGNTEAANGEVPSGITSGVALAAVRENAGKTSKDSNRASYRAMEKIYLMVVELIRQFYNMERQFRIVGEDGMMHYLAYSNANLQMRTQADGFGGVTHRIPLFDVDVHVQRENAYTRMAINDMATQFYQMGLFQPMNAPMALAMLQMMEFTGKDKLVRMIQQNFMSMMVQMGGSATGVQSQGAPGGGAAAEKGATTPTEDDATEAGVRKTGPDHTKATNRMEERMNNAARPDA